MGYETLRDRYKTIYQMSHVLVLAATSGYENRLKILGCPPPVRDPEHAAAAAKAHVTWASVLATLPPTHPAVQEFQSIFSLTPSQFLDQYS